MWTRCRYQMFLSAPPPVPMTILISFALALPRPFLTPGAEEVPESQRGAAMSIWSDWPFWRSTPPPPSLIRFSLISSPFLLYLQ